MYTSMQRNIDAMNILCRQRFLLGRLMVTIAPLIQPSAPLFCLFISNITHLFIEGRQHVRFRDTRFTKSLALYLIHKDDDALKHCLD